MAPGLDTRLVLILLNSQRCYKNNMPSRTPHLLTKRERQIMDVLYRLGRAPPAPTKAAVPRGPGESTLPPPCPPPPAIRPPKRPPPPCSTRFSTDRARRPSRRFSEARRHASQTRTS